MTSIPDVHALPIGAAPVGHTTPLIVFWVGDRDVFAARSAEQALDLCREQGCTDTETTYTLADVSAVSDFDLDKPIFDEYRTHCGNLRDALAAADQPCYLMGFE